MFYEFLYFLFSPKCKFLFSFTLFLSLCIQMFKYDSSALYKTATSIISFAVFLLISVFKSFTCFQRVGHLLAPFCCAFLTLFNALSKWSYSVTRFTNFHPTTVPSDSIIEQVAFLLRPKSTAHIIWS